MYRKIYVTGIHIQSFYLVLWQQLCPPAVVHHYIWEYSSIQIICQVGRVIGWSRSRLSRDVPSPECAWATRGQSERGAKICIAHSLFIDPQSVYFYGLAM